MRRGLFALVFRLFSGDRYGDFGRDRVKTLRPTDALSRTTALQP